MTKRCVICRQLQEKSQICATSFHKIPQDPAIRAVWLQNLNIQCDLSKDNYVCSKHFRATDIKITLTGKRCLTHGAVPISTTFGSSVDEMVVLSQRVPLREIANEGNVVDVPVTKRKMVLSEIASTSGSKDGEAGSKKKIRYVSPCRTSLSKNVSCSSPSSRTLTCSTPSSRTLSCSPSSSKTLTCSSPSGTLSSSPSSKTLSCSPQLSITSETELSIGRTTMVKKRATLRKRYVGDFTSMDIANPVMARRGLSIAKTKISAQRRKIKSLQQRVRRLTKSVKNLKSLLLHLKKQLYITEQAAIVIQDSVPAECKEIFNRILQGSQKQKYTPLLRTFAITLNFYSPRAYAYVRNVFNKSLPHPHTISKWYQSVNGAPGFTTESLDMVKQKVEAERAIGKSVICNLVIDEMAIRKQIEFSKNRFIGYVDVGTNINSDSLPEAREALVLMLVAVNACWKIPVGYFLIDGLSASERAVIIKRCLEFTHSTGVIIKSITFDGSSSNLRMATELGADISNGNNLKVYFPHPMTDEPVYILLDPCHMIKLVRNCLGTYKIIEDGEGNFINWNYLTTLVNVQNIEGLHAANKLRQRHLDWAKEKMRVSIATQTFSKSESDALIYLRDIKQEFKECTATSKFILYVNNLFDIFNSRTKFAKYPYKRPLSNINSEHVFLYLEEIKDYILSLKVDGRSILDTQRKTGFLGFLICIDSIKHIYNDLVIEKKLLKYIITYKFSQDHIELFFGTIRSKGGFNNNPTAKQFEAAYKRILVYSEIKASRSGNTVPLEHIPVLHCGSQHLTGNDSTVNIMETSEYNKWEQTVMELVDHDYLRSPDHLTDYTVDIVAYISGFVVKTIEKSIVCTKCRLLLRAQNSLSRLQDIKEYKNLQKASYFVVKVCKVGESTFRNLIHTTNILTSKSPNILHTFVNKTLSALPTNIYDEFADHFFDAGDELANHCVDLIKIILRCYVKIRLHHETKIMLEKNLKKRIRNVLTKTILFANQ